jgi:Short C-terminal domain
MTTPSDALHAPGEPRVERALEHIRTMLIPGETLEAWAIQRRLFALTHPRFIIIATSGRFIGVQRRILGGFKPVDVRWQDLKEVTLYVGTFGADVGISAYGTSDRAVENLPTRSMAFMGLRKEQAQQVYRNCQSYEQQWREKRRVRELEELRAQSGGVQIGTGMGAGGPAGDAEGGSSVKRLQQAKEMLAAGLISDAEYEAIKARIINAV